MWGYSGATRVEGSVTTNTRIERTVSRVLVVEDDAQLRQIIASNLTMRGHMVRQAGDTSAAIQALAREQPNLLILDINLPDGTGWDVLSEAKLPDSVRVLVLTAVPVSPRHLAEFGPLVYLPKPFPLDALLRMADNRQPMERDDAASTPA